MTIALCSMLLVGLPVLNPATASGQDRRPRVGVVLSSGGARALSHIGVLEVLEEMGITVDFVVGTGIGGLVGGLYAAGYSVDSIARIAESLNWARILRDPVDRRDYPREEHELEGYYLLAPVSQGRLATPAGLLANHRIEQVLLQLVPPAETERDFDRLNRPFRVVARDALAGEQIVMSVGVLSDAMRAAAAMGSIFPPLELGGRQLEHGGLGSPLPSDVAHAIGADVVVCSDVTDPFPLPDGVVTFFDRFASSLSFQESSIAVERRRLCDVLILPDVGAISSLQFDRVAEAIARGGEATRRSAPSLEQLKGMR